MNLNFYTNFKNFSNFKAIVIFENRILNRVYLKPFCAKIRNFGNDIFGPYEKLGSLYACANSRKNTKSHLNVQVYI